MRSLLFSFVACVILVNQRDVSAQNYCIKEGYIARTGYCHFDDTENQDAYQDDVYLIAYKISKDNNYNRIADIGCGSGFKLLKYFKDCETVGFEIEPTLSFLSRTYPSRNWQISDFQKDPKSSSFDLIVCSDVIEHLMDPSALLNWLDKFDFKFLVISTPDRDQLIFVQEGMQSQSGPPVNPAHVREWSFGEFESYIGKYFDIVDHFRSEKEFWDQIIVVKKKGL